MFRKKIKLKNSKFLVLKQLNKNGRFYHGAWFQKKTTIKLNKLHYNKILKMPEKIDIFVLAIF